MAKGFSIPKAWNCKKVKGKKMAICSPGRKPKKTTGKRKRSRKK